LKQRFKKDKNMTELSSVLSVKQQDEFSRSVLRERLDTILPLAMREANLDMWLVICQEDDYDPVFKTMVPQRTWAPILQMLVFFNRGEAGGIERINLSMTDLGDLYTKPWSGREFTEQWPLLAQIIAERSPRRIGINTGAVEWAAGGLTHNLFEQLCAALPPETRGKLVSAEVACTRWLETLCPAETQVYPHLAHITHQIIAECYRRVTPGITTSDDLQWEFWQISQDMGLEQSFNPFFNLVRSDARKTQWPVEDRVIHPGDLIHCDVGNRYLRLCSDMQEWAYVREPGEADAPSGLKNLFSEVNRLQQVFMGEFRAGLSGDELLANILGQARAAGIPGPRIYSHSLGYYLHEPGPLIGLPWQQERNPGRGEVRLVPASTFTMELSIDGTVPEWGGQVVRFSCEEDVLYTGAGCYAMDGVQKEYHLI
jgi:hypothetical protein